MDGYEPIEFINKTTLTINGLAGSDEINLNNPHTPTGLTDITVTGGQTGGTNTLIVNGIPGVTDDILYTPTASGSGTVTDTAPTFVPVTFSNMEHLTIVGQSPDADILRTANVAGDNTYEVTPRATPDAGSITGFLAGEAGYTFTPLSFQGINGFVNPNSGAAGGADTLIVDGTAANDTFLVANSVNNPGSLAVTKNGRPEIISPASPSWVFRGLDGNDTFNLNFNPLTTDNLIALNVQGGSGANTLNYTALRQPPRPLTWVPRPSPVAEPIP